MTTSIMNDSQNIDKGISRKRLIVIFPVCAVLSLIAACLTVLLLADGAALNILFQGLYGRRVELLAVVYLILSMHAAFDITLLYDTAFRYRWLLAAVFFLFMVLNQFHLSSVGAYDWSIQHDAGSDFIRPVYGTPRHIRGDEWMVSTPWGLSAQYGDAYAEHNYIIRGTQSDNISTSGLYFAYSALANILNFGFYLFGPAYGLSIATCGKLILSLMIAFEFFLVITGENRLMSLLGAVLTAFSAFLLWWSLASFSYIICPMLIVACLYRFLFAKRYLHRILLGAAIALALSNLICNLYPAWQVPAAYVLLAMFVAVVIKHWDAVKGLRLKDYAIVIATLLFAASIVWANFSDRAAYIEAIGATTYPGQRRDAGGYALDQLFLCFQAFLYPFKDMDNPCEPSGFFVVFPVSFFVGMYVWYKNKRANVLLLLLNMLSVFFTIYVTVGLPSAAARVTLMDFSTEERVIPFLGFAQMIVMVVALGQNHLLPAKKTLGIAAGIVSAALPIYVCLENFPGYMPSQYIAVIAPIFFSGGYLLCTRVPGICGDIAPASAMLSGDEREGKRDSQNRSDRRRVPALRSNLRLFAALCLHPVRLFKPAFAAVLILLTLASSLCIHPIMKGLDVIYSKPAAIAVRNIVEQEPDAKWIAMGNTENSGFLLACGAPTLNSVNYIPNWEMYERLDPSGEYSDIYNRYHHIRLVLTTEETVIAPAQSQDRVDLTLSFADFEKIDISYIFTMEPLESNEYVQLTAVYDEFGTYIYKVMYQ